MSMDPQLPQLAAPPPELVQKTWRDLSEEEAEARVLDGGSLLLLGIASVGKTHFLRGVVERLRAAGKSVAVVSKTHACPSNNFYLS